MKEKHCVLYVGISGNCVIEFDKSLPVRLIVNWLVYKHCHQDWKLSKDVMTELKKSDSDWHQKLQRGQGVYGRVSGIRVQLNLIIISINYSKKGLHISLVCRGCLVDRGWKQRDAKLTKKSHVLQWNFRHTAKSVPSGNMRIWDGDIWKLFPHVYV